MSARTDRIAEIEAEITQIDLMIANYSAAGGIQEVGIGGSRTRRVDLEVLFRRKDKLRSQLSALRAGSGGRVVVERS